MLVHTVQGDKMNRPQSRTWWRLSGAIAASAALTLAAAWPASAAEPASVGASQVDGYAFCSSQFGWALPCGNVTLFGNGQTFPEQTPSPIVAPGIQGHFTFPDVPDGFYVIETTSPQGPFNANADDCTKRIYISAGTAWFPFGPWGSADPCNGGG